jgi:hypothetical protein
MRRMLGIGRAGRCAVAPDIRIAGMQRAVGDKWRWPPATHRLRDTDAGHKRGPWRSCRIGDRPYAETRHLFRDHSDKAGASGDRQQARLKLKEFRIAEDGDVVHDRDGWVEPLDLAGNLADLPQYLDQAARQRRQREGRLGFSARGYSAYQDRTKDAEMIEDRSAFLRGALFQLDDGGRTGELSGFEGRR